MQADINQVIMSGLVSKFKYGFSQFSSKKIVSFVLEVKEQWRNKEGELKTWFNRFYINWESLEEDFNFSDGSYVLVHGKLKNSSKEVKGEKQYFTNIVASNVVSVGKPQENQSDCQSSFPRNIEQEDLPF